jgi:hypothetical protein
MAKLQWSITIFPNRMVHLTGDPHFPLRLQEPYGASQLHVAHFLALGRKNLVLASDTGTLETFTRNTPKLKLEHIGT